MEHTLSFLPGPETPPSCRFTVETLQPRSCSQTLHVSARMFMLAGDFLVLLDQDESAESRLGPSTLPVSCLRSRHLWKRVAGCSQLTAAQTCNLTLALEEPFGIYQARVRGYVSNLTSPWTVSSWFQPLTDSESRRLVFVCSLIGLLSV